MDPPFFIGQRFLMVHYLDAAATSWPKPAEVGSAMLAALDIAGAPGRGGHRGALQGAHLIDQTRMIAAKLLGAASDREVVFTSGGTESLNLALMSLLNPGDHVVTTAAEHNSVLRPLEQRRLQEEGEYTVVSVDDEGRLDHGQMLAAVTPQTRLVVATHVSNVTGVIQPIEELAEALCERGIALLVDAAQSAGHLQLEARRFPGVAWAMSGHKGLLGPLGSGVVIFGNALTSRIKPWKCGGTGIDSEQLGMPLTLPARLEAGNPALPAIAGLRAALEWLEPRHASLAGQLRERTEQLWQGLDRIPAVRRFGPKRLEEHRGPTSIQVEGWEPHDLASVLEASFEIRVRAGRHCAALIHQALGTSELGGTVRITPGHETSAESIDHLLASLQTLAQS